MCLPPLLIDSLPDANRSCRHFALEDADDAGGLACIFKFDRLDRSMRMGRRQETGLSLTGKSPIRDVHAPSAQQTLVFEAVQRLANPERSHKASFVSTSK
jgi:hypothetical protein